MKIKPDISIGDVSAADLLVCAHVTEPPYMPDNLIGQCQRCLRLIQFRPHAPQHVKRICVDCAGPMLAAAKARGEKVRLQASETTAAEVRDWFKKQS